MMLRDAYTSLLSNAENLSSYRAQEDAVLLSPKEEYRRFSARERLLPVFARDWWLDALAGAEGWDAAIVKHGHVIFAAMPYTIRRRLGFLLLGQPALTQKLGPWIRALDGNTAARLSFERELLQGLIDRLPRFDHFAQNWHYSRTNWLPFYWNGFRQTLRYSYVLSDLDSTANAWRRLHHNARNECNKAVRRCGLRVRDDLPLDTLLALNRLTFARQGLPAPYPDAIVHRLHAACSRHAAGKSFVAVDRHGRPHAGVYIAWDDNSTYALISGTDPALRHSGASTLCFWHAIQHAACTTGQFDFGGSMMQSVERFFRGFGARQIPYFSISRTPSLLLHLRQRVLDELKRS